MEILEKHVVRRYGRYLVMEGPVRTPDAQEISLYWVEDADGAPMTSFSCEDVATDLALRLAQYDGSDEFDDEAPEQPDERGPHRLH